MGDYIRIEKVLLEETCMKLKVTASSPVITACSEIYVTEDMISELQEQIDSFLKDADLEGYWENDVPGIGGPPCVTLRLYAQDDWEQVLLDIYMELNDGGSFKNHNCRFYVRSSRQALRQFCADLSSLKGQEIGTCVTLPQG